MKLFLGAVVDGMFLTDLAETLLQKQEVLKVPVLMGITNHEFGWILPQVTQIQINLTILCYSVTASSRLPCASCVMLS